MPAKFPFLFVLCLTCLLPSGCFLRRGSSLSKSPDAQSYSPEVALDGSGNGVVIWLEGQRLPEDSDAASQARLLAQTYSPDAGFSRTFEVFGAACTQPQVGMDRFHTAHVCGVLQRSETIRQPDLIAATISASGGTAPVTLDTLKDFIVEPSLAVSSEGGALLAWRNGLEIRASYFVPGSGWTLPPLVLCADPSVVEAGDVTTAINANGIGIVTYTRILADESQRIAHWFSPFRDPLAGERIDEGAVEMPGGYSFLPSGALAIDPAGNVLTSYVSVTSSADYEVRGRYCDTSSGWQPSVVVGSSSTNRIKCEAGLDAIGHGILAWRTADTNESGSHFVSEFDPAQGFAAAQDLTGQNWLDHVLAVTNRGEAIAVFKGADDLDYVNRLSCVRYAPALGWSAGRQFEPVAGDGGLDIFSPRVAQDDSGLALCVWAARAGKTPDGSRSSPFNPTDADIYVQVFGAPRPSLTASNLAPNVGESIKLDGSKSRVLTSNAVFTHVEWDFEGDGVIDLDAVSQPAFGLVQTFDCTHAGTFHPTLRVTDDWGDVASVSQDVVVGGGGGGGDGSGPPWRLTVVMEGPGSNRVYSYENPPKIDCPADCEDLYDDDGFVYLYVEPGSGRQFDHWEGVDLDNGSEGCEVFMTSDRTVKAVFQ